MAGSFTLDISRFVNKARLRMDDVVRGAMYGLSGNVIKTTPVDTGKARGNWVISMDGYTKVQTEVLDKSGERSLDRIARQLEGFQAGKTKSIWLTNSLPYIVMLEYGWSKQAPAGMVRLSLLTFNGVAVQSIGVGGK